MEIQIEKILSDMSKSVAQIAEAQTGHGTVEALCLSMIDGSKEKYYKAMKLYFDINNANELTPTKLTALVAKWYEMTRKAFPWDGYSEFYQPDVSAVTDGVKGGDNTGMVCNPSTDTVAGQDDYAGHPLFAPIDVNVILDDTTREPIITAIDGITDNFERYSPSKYVAVMQMSGFVYQEELSSVYRIGYASEPFGHKDVAPLAEAVKFSDNTMRQFVVHAKYMNHLDGNKLTSYSGVVPTGFVISHNSIQNYAKNNGTNYSGGSILDYAFLQLMFFIKYGKLSADGVIQGCVNYSYQNYALLGETNVNRILLTPSQAKQYIVGSTVLLGNYATSTDRYYLWSVSGQDGRIVTEVKNVTIDSVEYGAVYVDGEPFDTNANGSATTGTTYISTYHWRNGTNDKILGNDGSIVSASNGAYPAKLQGIEYSVGGYETYADVILNQYAKDDGKTVYEPFTVNDVTKQATSVTGNYKASGLVIEHEETEGWKYIKKVGRADGFFFPTLVGGSSSTFLKDAFWMHKQGTTGEREWLAFGGLYGGSAHGGLSCLFGDYGLSTAGWYVLARLSLCGSRGEWSA